jgi:RNA polymerase sigma-70 factor, ECF subfamily
MHNLQPPDDMLDLSDQALLDKIQAGQDDAATALYMRYAEQLRRVAVRQTSQQLSTRLEPDDVVQSVFRTFFRRLSLDQNTVPQGDDLWKLFLVIALNKIRNLAAFHRAAKRDVRQTTELEDTSPTSPTPPDDDLQTLQWVIDDILQAQPESTRQMVTLRIQGHDVNDIAEKSGRSKRSVERVLQQFREQLKGQLDADH